MNELEKAAVEACKRLAMYPRDEHAVEDCYEAGVGLLDAEARALVEAEKKWKAELAPGSVGLWRVYGPDRAPLLHKAAQYIYLSGATLSEAQAQAIADALNNLESKDPSNAT